MPGIIGMLRVAGGGERRELAGHDGADLHHAAPFEIGSLHGSCSACV
jgi:hypothetical protein